MGGMATVVAFHAHPDDEVLLTGAAPDIRAGFTPRSAITHRVNMRPYARQKPAALAAHGSQIGPAGRASRLFWLMVRLPVPVFGLLFGREWFAEVTPGASRLRGERTLA